MQDLVQNLHIVWLYAWLWLLSMSRMLQDTKYMMKSSLITQNYRDYVKFRQKWSPLLFRAWYFNWRIYCIIY